MTRLQHFPSCFGGLRWMVTYEFCGSGITEEFCTGATSFGGDAAWRGAKMGVAFEKWPPTSLCVRQRRT